MAVRKKTAMNVDDKKSITKPVPKAKKAVVWDENACRAILEELEKEGGPLYTRQIAGNITDRLGIRVGKKTVNRYLYGILLPKVRRTEDDRWVLLSVKAKPGKAMKPVKAAKAVKAVKKKAPRVVVKKKTVKKPR
ncbi:MAG: hypothetical protein AABZ39_20990 [Spirochaetota bacterium]